MEICSIYLTYLQNIWQITMSAFPAPSRLVRLQHVIFAAVCHLITFISAECAQNLISTRLQLK